MNKISPEKLERLNKLIKSIEKDLIMIKYQSEEYRKIIKAYNSKYKSEIDQTDDFWWLHILSVSNHINLLLSKVYDTYDKQNRKKPDQQVITLHTLIYFIENDLQLCDKSKKDKLQKTINLHKKQLDDNLVEKITKIRNNIIAHKNEKQFLKTAKTLIEPLTWDELDELVKRGLDICNIYREYYNNGQLFQLYENHDSQFMKSYHSPVIYMTDGMYRNNHKKILKALRIKNIVYKFLKNIENIDEYPDDVKAFQQEFYDELSYTGYEPELRHKQP